MHDRYTRAVLTVIALCLVHLCVADVLRGTPAAAQVYSTPRPGEQTGPLEVIVVGWQNFPQDGLPVQIVGGSLPANAAPLRVVLAGWEEQPFALKGFSGDGLPVRGAEGPRPAPAVRVNVVKP